MSILIDLVGHRFGRLQVLKRVENNKYGESQWNCLCDCGTKKVIRQSSLRNGRTKSCGCIQKEKTSARNRKPYGEASFNSVYSAYKNSAVVRRLDFNLEITFFKKMTQEPCFYCGIEPQQIRRSADQNGNGDYVYNGLDRVDSSRGYSEDNVVACCITCNKAKLNTSQSDFLSWIKRVYNYSIDVKN